MTGILARTFATERKTVSVDKIWDAIMNAGRRSTAGPIVTDTSATRVSALFACGRAISQGCAQVPFRPYQRITKDGLVKLRVAEEHELYDATVNAPNPHTTSFELREQMAIHAAFAGDSYVWKNFRRGGYRELIPLDPRKVKPIYDGYDLTHYELTGADGKKEPLPPDEVWHTRGPGWNGTTGYDVLAIARDALGLSMALEESHARMHSNAVRPSGLYSIEGTLDDKQHAQLEKWIKTHAGANKTGTPLILDKGATWLSQQLNGVDAQHNETRRLQIEEICRFMFVWPMMVMSSDKAQTYASAEQMFLAHVVHTLSPWYARFEQTANLSLLSPEERKAGYYFKFMAAGLMRGASKDRAEYFSKALGVGGSTPWMTQDEVRELDELNPFGGEAATLLPRMSAIPGAAPAPDNNPPDPGNPQQ